MYPGWSRTHYVDRASLELINLCLKVRTLKVLTTIPGRMRNPDLGDAHLQAKGVSYIYWSHFPDSMVTAEKLF